VAKECTISPLKKKSVLFFRGSNTSQGRGNVRGYLADIKATQDLPLLIDVPREKRAPTLVKFDPIWSFCKYKYLLNLPGAQPWSYRKKFLYLLQSLVIDIVFRQQFSANDVNEPWINFYDCVFEPGQDYVQLVYNSIPEKGKVVDLNKDDYKQIVTDLTSTYKTYESEPDKYTKMVESCSTKANMINLKLIYRSVFSLLLHYSECVKRDGGAQSYTELRADKHNKPHNKRNYVVTN
jgi:hypothetical protein